MSAIANEYWEQIEALFAATLALSPEEREALLEASGCDASQRELVERLVTAHEKSGKFLAELPIDGIADIIRSVEAPLEKGSYVGPYRIERELGRGGMGRVYLAQDTALHRPVALKFLPPHLNADERAKNRLIREARAASRLDHPHIAVVHDIGESADGQLYIAMAYYEGETLREKLKAGPLPLESTLDLFEQITRALAAAHAEGIVHRDVKPGNVIVLPPSEVSHRGETAKLVDFGIATAADQADRVDGGDGADQHRLDGSSRDDILQNESTGARTGAIRGTLPYMCPEGTRGEAVSAAGDVWSLGVLLYEMLAGRRPFPGETVGEVIDAIREREPDSLQPLVPEAPAAIVEIVNKCLEKDPTRRYPDAGALLAALHATNVQTPRRQRGAVSRTGRWALVAGVAAVIVIALTSRQFLAGSRDRPIAEDVAPTIATTLEPRLIAVLPLDNLSDDPDDEYFAASIGDEVAARLARRRGVRVVSGSSMLAHLMRRGTYPDRVPEIGGDLGAELVLVGRADKHGNQASLEVELLAAERDSIIWSGQYDSQLSGVFPLADTVVRHIAISMGLPAQDSGPDVAERAFSVHPEANELYLKARYYWNKRTGEDLQRAKALFEEAIDVDPVFARAWAGLAELYNVYAGYNLSTIDESYPRARAAAERALALDSTLAEAHAALATVLSDYYWRSDDAEHHFRKAIESDPDQAVALYWFSEFLANRGRFEEALVMARRAQEADPFSLIAHADEGRVYYLSRRYGEAIRHFKKTLELGDQFVAYLYLGLSYAQSGMLDEAIATLERALVLYPYPDVMALLANVYARAGRQADATRLLDELLALREKEDVEAAVIAAVHVGMGDTEATLTWLERGFEERNWQMTFLATEPVFDPVREEPRFQELLSRVRASP